MRRSFLASLDPLDVLGLGAAIGAFAVVLLVFAAASFGA